MKKLLVVLLPLTLSSTAAMAEVYTWKDAKGTSFYTNSIHEIPARYLKRARVLDVATGKKGAPATAHPGTPAGPAPAVGQAPSSLPHSPFPQPQPAPAAAAPAPVPTTVVPTVAAPASTPAQPTAESAPARPQQAPTAAQRRARRSAASHRNETE